VSERWFILHTLQTLDIVLIMAYTVRIYETKVSEKCYEACGNVHSMLGILSGLPEIWIQLYSLWEMINFTPPANIGLCIEQGIYSQNLWSWGIWEMLWGLKDVHSMLGTLLGLPEIWIQLYSVWETIQLTPLRACSIALNKLCTVTNHETKSIWEVIWGLKGVHGMLGIFSRFPEIWIQL